MHEVEPQLLFCTDLIYRYKLYTVEQELFFFAQLRNPYGQYNPIGSVMFLNYIWGFYKKKWDYFSVDFTIYLQVIVFEEIFFSINTVCYLLVLIIGQIRWSILL